MREEQLTRFKHLVGHEQVIQTADVVPARQEHQDGAVLRRQKNKQSQQFHTQLDSCEDAKLIQQQGEAW